MKTEIVPLRAFRDNYIWAVHNGRHAAVIDPGDAAPVLEFLRAGDLRLCAVLCTHHHADHVGGCAQLRFEYNVPIIGPAAERIDALTTRVRGGDSVTVPELALRFDVLDIPGHTAGHIAFTGHGWLFCGDTLFSVGCGRLFEGTPAQMHASLLKLASLPDHTQVFCGHEYTAGNIRFATLVEPHNAALLALRNKVDALARQGLPSLPSLMGEERSVNPFLRTAVPEVRAAAERRAQRILDDDVAVFAVLRDWKNQPS
ncbi:MAG: hydroxyacylglutathione hydrolase [Betaproteobacteria bacterium]